MNLGIIGLPQVGKKTIFKLLTGQDAEKAMSRHGIRYGIAPVKDPRIDRLNAMYNPKKTRYAEFEIALPPDVTPNAAHAAEWMTPLRNVDAFLHVVRAFEAPGVYHIEGSVDPGRDLELLQTEFLLADLHLVETRLERLAKELRKNDTAGQREKAVLEKCQGYLEEEIPLRNLELNEEEKKHLHNLQLFTLKPTAVVFNVSEDQAPAVEKLQTLWKKLENQGDTVVSLSADIESELAELDEEEKASFMEELGLQEPAAHRLSRAAYESLGLISFFTVGEDEVRGWSVREDAPAPEAAGKIHSDIERGFIRAETTSYEDLLEAGSEKKAKEANLTRAEGKEYIVKDGDIMNFRFSV
ncbi:MAG: redox-regulated ATPase YchF [Lentisphaeria bacterium]